MEISDRSDSLIRKTSVVNEHFLVRIHLDDRTLKTLCRRVTIQVQIVRSAVVPLIRNPGLNDVRSRPNVVIVLPGVIVGRRSERFGIALRETNEVRESDFILKPGKCPTAVSARFVAEQ